MIGEKVRKARKAKGLTLVEVAAAINVTHAALSKIETGKSEASRRTLVDLAKALGDNFGLDWLDEHLNGASPMPSKKDVVAKMSTREFLSLKFGGKEGRRSKAEAEMLAKLLDAEIERIKKEEGG